MRACQDILSRVRSPRGLLSTLRRRNTRPRPKRLVLSTLTVLAGVTLVVAGIAVELHKASPPHKPLIAHGNCAGLTLDATARTTIWHVAPGTNSHSIAMPVGGTLDLHASGPCADILVYETRGSALRGPSTASGGYFSPLGMATFIASQPGTQHISFVLGCSDRDVPCLDNLGPRLATLDVVVSP